MKDFTYYNPTRIEFGHGKENNVGEYIKGFGIEKVLLVFGSDRIKHDGLFDRVTASLSANGVAFEAFGGIVSNPLISKVKDGVKVALETNVQAVLAVGGGSVLDSVKAIAAGAKYSGDIWDLFTFKSPITEALPIFSVMTLAATGSEMNQGAVVTNDETREKYAITSPALFPKVSVVNPELMTSVGRDYLAYSAVDIIAHSVDVYFSATYIPEFNSGLIELIIKTVMRTTEVLLKNTDDYDARAEFAWAATQALNGSTVPGMEGNSFPTHMVEHAMSALHNVPHGAGLAMVIPAWFKFYQERNPAQFDRFAKEVFGVNTGAEGITALEQWFVRIGAPVTLEQGGIPREAIPALTDNAYGLALMWGLDAEYSKEDITRILELACA